MSREFGSYMSGYFHHQMQYAAEDCASGKDELTRLWGKFFEEFYHVAYQIANSEACDSGPDAPIIETIQRLPALKKHLDDIEKYTRTYKDCMEEAVRQALKKEKNK